MPRRVPLRIFYRAVRSLGEQCFGHEWKPEARGKVQCGETHVDGTVHISPLGDEKAYHFGGSFVPPNILPDKMVQRSLSFIGLCIGVSSSFEENFGYRLVDVTGCHMKRGHATFLEAAIRAGRNRQSEFQKGLSYLRIVIFRCHVQRGCSPRKAFEWVRASLHEHKNGLGLSLQRDPGE